MKNLPQSSDFMFTFTLCVTCVAVSLALERFIAFYLSL